jgi:hypothetical protein
MSLANTVLLVNSIAAPAGQLVLAAVIWRRRLVRRMPWFFVYTVWVMASSPVLVLLNLRTQARGTSSWFEFYTGWTAEAISVGLGFAVIYEVFHHVFQPYPAFRRVAPVLFRWCGVGLLLLGSASALLSSPDHSFRVIAGLLVIERTLRVVQVGLLLLVLVACRYLRMSWRLEVLGVAMGFGMYAAVAIVCMTLQSQLGPGVYYTLGMVTGTAYTCAVMIWAAYFLAPQPATQAAQVMPQNTDVEQWNQALSHLLQQ